MTWEEYYGNYKNSGSYGDLMSGYNSTVDTLSKNYQSDVDAQNKLKESDIAALTQARDYNQGLLNKQNEQSQGAAYVNYRQGQKSLPLLLGAQGYGGGASEQSGIDLNRSYENSRIANDRTLSDATGALGQSYNANVGDTNSKYAAILANLLGQKNTNLLNAKNQYDADLYSRAQGAYGLYTQEEARKEVLRQYEEQMALQREAAAEAQRQFDLQIA